MASLRKGVRHSVKEDVFPSSYAAKRIDEVCFCRRLRRNSSTCMRADFYGVRWISRSRSNWKVFVGAIPADHNLFRSSRHGPGGVLGNLPLLLRPIPAGVGHTLRFEQI